jgi:hypothetical protein
MEVDFSYMKEKNRTIQEILDHLKGNETCAVSFKIDPNTCFVILTHPEEDTVSDAHVAFKFVLDEILGEGVYELAEDAHEETK